MKALRIVIDIFMTLFLLFLMGYMITGDLAHEIAGTATIALWIVHLILNRRWYGTLLKGRYSLKRAFHTAVNILLTFSMAGLIFSSIILSSYVFRFLGIERGMDLARQMHLICSYWCFVLTSLHLGLHWGRIIGMMRKKGVLKLRMAETLIIRFIIAVLSFIGIWAFIEQQLAAYMFRRSLFVFFDYEQSPLFFFLKYICMMVLFASLSYYSHVFLKLKKPGREVLK